MAAGIIAFHRIAAAAWAFGIYQASADDFLGFSSGVFVILSFVIFFAAWEVKKMSERYRLVELRQMKEYALRLGEQLGRKRRKK
ncbi:TPA: hypothetical protein HA243_04715 [Candidatus Micrarchaeota archaeon]|nr:hypothetical protein [Candidatus Micrarchaeota archaeon]